MESLYDADRDYLVQKGMATGYRIFSLVTPPLYVAFVLTRRGRGALTAHNLLRSTWYSAAIGCIGGAAFERARCAFSSDDVVRARRIKRAYNTAAIRADDHSTIGALVFGLLTPAIFWKRASIVNLILGGAGIGSAIGSCVHYGRTLSGDPAPQIAIPPLPSHDVPES